MLTRLRTAIPGLISIAIVVSAGRYSKSYRGPAYHWVNDSLGGVFYCILWCLVVGLLLPSVRAGLIAAAVLIVTCILEFMQLWHPPFLEYLRSFYLGRTILGSYFDWSDFPYYFAGSALGWLWLHAVRPPNRLS
jgi:Protein of unknown function (DUF2809)